MIDKDGQRNGEELEEREGSDCDGFRDIKCKIVSSGTLIGIWMISVSI